MDTYDYTKVKQQEGKRRYPSHKNQYYHQTKINRNKDVRSNTDFMSKFRSVFCGLYKRKKSGGSYNKVTRLH